jgi:uncharacterized protein YciI
MTIARLLKLLLAAVLVTSLTGPVLASDSECVWWVFLTKGPNRDPLESELAEKLQAQHVGNLGRLGELGVGLMAGPLGDDGFIRGIVVVKARDLKTVNEYFKPDPFVQMGRLAVVASPWLVDSSGIGKPETPFRLSEHTLVVFRKGPHWKDPKGPLNADSMYALLPVLRDIKEEGGLVLCGPLTDGGDVVGIAFWRSGDPTPIRERLSREPAVTEGVIVVETHPQFLGAGVLGSKAASK